MKGLIGLGNVGGPPGTAGSVIMRNVLHHEGEGAPFFDLRRSPVALHGLAVDFHVYIGAHPAAVRACMEAQRADRLEAHGRAAGDSAEVPPPPFDPRIARPRGFDTVEPG